MMVTQISDGVAQLDVETPGSSDFAIEIIHLCSLRLKNYEKRDEGSFGIEIFSRGTRFFGGMDLAFEIFSRGPRIFGGMDLAFEIFSRGLGFLAGWIWHLRFFLGGLGFEVLF
jgi:hypothetical protein